MAAPAPVPVAVSVLERSVLDRLRDIVGAQAVLTGDEALPYITDVYRRRETPLAVVRPGGIEDLRAVVREAAAEGLALFPRGGGASYSDAYLPTREQSLVVDLGRMDRIVEINRGDAFVTVEAGVTWAQLKAALDPLGLRTPFFGPFSGLAATVGGSVSQNSLSHGSGAHGISAQSVLGLEVVVASGEVVRTGSAARGAAPFARFYGPDLAGLFTGDCGALGIKAHITLPLLAKKPAFGCASFAFDDFAHLASAMRALAMAGIDDEHFALDAALGQGQIARQEGAGAILGMAKAVLASSPSLLAGVTKLVRMALAGSTALAEAEFALHVIVEGFDAREVASRLDRLRTLMAAGREIPDSVPRVVRGMPFAPLFNTLGPKGERWVPVHGVLAHSKVCAFHEALNALYREQAAEMTRLGVWKGGMFGTVGAAGFLYEVALYWPGAQTDYHRAAVPAAHLAGLPTYAEDAQVQAFVETLKAQIIALYGRFDAIHFQLGKTYPFADVLQREPLALLRAVKRELDPEGLMNPGALGL